MQPIAVILKPVEIAERRGPLRLISTQAPAVRMKVPLHPHRADCQARTLFPPVAIPHRVQMPIHDIQQPVHGVRGPRGSRQIIGREKIGRFRTQLLDHLCYPAVKACPRPLPEAAHTLRERALGLRPVEAPGLVEHLAPQRPAAALGDLQDRVQETAAPASGPGRVLSRPRASPREPSVQTESG